VIEDADKKIKLKATARIMTFEGFTAIYKTTEEDSDASSDQKDNGQYKALSKVSERQAVEKAFPNKDKHSTRPPLRYREASIIKSMESLGIGRPSTFASITALLIISSFPGVDFG